MAVTFGMIDKIVAKSQLTEWQISQDGRIKQKTVVDNFTALGMTRKDIFLNFVTILSIKNLMFEANFSVYQ
jgi:hypothetical protein